MFRTVAEPFGREPAQLPWRARELAGHLGDGHRCGITAGTEVAEPTIRPGEMPASNGVTWSASSGATVSGATAAGPDPDPTSGVDVDSAARNRGMYVS